MTDSRFDLIAVNDDQHLVYTEQERKEAFWRLYKRLDKPAEYVALGQCLHRILTELYEDAECSEEDKSERHLWFVALDKFEECVSEGFSRQHTDLLVKAVEQFMREYIGLHIVD